MANLPQPINLGLSLNSFPIWATLDCYCWPCSHFKLSSLYQLDTHTAFGWDAWNPSFLLMRLLCKVHFMSAWPLCCPLTWATVAVTTEVPVLQARNCNPQMSPLIPINCHIMQIKWCNIGGQPANSIFGVFTTGLLVCTGIPWQTLPFVLRTWLFTHITWSPM